MEDSKVRGNERNCCAWGVGGFGCAAGRCETRGRDSGRPRRGMRIRRDDSRIVSTALGRNPSCFSMSNTPPEADADNYFRQRRKISPQCGRGGQSRLRPGRMQPPDTSNRTGLRDAIVSGSADRRLMMDWTVSDCRVRLKAGLQTLGCGGSNRGM